MNIVATAIDDMTSALFKNYAPVIFDPYMVKAMNMVHDNGTTFKYLSETVKLNISDTAMNYLGASLAGNLKGVSPGLRTMELLSDVTDIEVSNVYGSPSIFTPEQFWNNVTKILERERTLVHQKDSVLGDDTFGVVFLVEKAINKDTKKKVAVNLYRESWKDGTEYYITKFDLGGTWERGHCFAIKTSL